MRRLMPGLCLTLAAAALGHAQTFEAASIRVVKPSEGQRGPSRIEPTPGNLSMHNVGMAELLMWAYKVGRPRVANPQIVITVTDRFDVVGKAAGPANSDELHIMLQALLAERFKLSTHFE